MPSIRLKICGITRLEDALTAAAGAHALGFIFHPASPRAVTPAQAKEIIARLPPLVVTVGVFVEQTVEEINRITEQAGVDRIQLHGNPAHNTHSFNSLARLNRPAYRVFSLKNAQDVERVAGEPDDTLLLDTYHPTLPGGTGQTSDWSLAAQLARRKNVILAGGLTPDNIAGAVAQVRPYGVDVNSGVESSPGVKDGKKIKRLFQVLKEM
ncbi:MAG: phosphoribosylanthranilate isomerase [Deltaproteobacteria bacterium]|nr:phosphoribosylanthranilate isomerase [Deltaproteobacteria bacterium]